MLRGTAQSSVRETAVGQAKGRKWNQTESSRPCVQDLAMGLFKKLASALGMSKAQMRILVVGLDNSGKSTLIDQVKQPSKVSEVASI